MSTDLDIWMSRFFLFKRVMFVTDMESRYPAPARLLIHVPLIEKNEL